MGQSPSPLLCFLLLFSTWALSPFSSCGGWTFNLLTYIHTGNAPTWNGNSHALPPPLIPSPWLLPCLISLWLAIFQASGSSASSPTPLACTHTITEKKNLQERKSPSTNSLKSPSFSVLKISRHAPRSPLRTRRNSCPLPSLFFQNTSTKCCCSMNAGACSWRLQASPSIPMYQVHTLLTMNPFREERQRSVDHTRRIPHVRLHCSSSSSHRCVKLGEPLSNSFCTRTLHHLLYLVDILIQPIPVVAHADVWEDAIGMSTYLLVPRIILCSTYDLYLVPIVTPSWS